MNRKGTAYIITAKNIIYHIFLFNHVKNEWTFQRFLDLTSYGKTRKHRNIMLIAWACTFLNYLPIITLPGNQSAKKRLKYVQNVGIHRSFIMNTKIFAINKKKEKKNNPKIILPNTLFQKQVVKNISLTYSYFPTSFQWKGRQK